MSMPDRRPLTTSLAAVMAGIITLSLVTPAPDVDVALLRAEVHDVQLTAAATAPISTLAVSPAVRGTVAAAASTVAPTPATATSPSANPVAPLAATSAATATDVVSTIQKIANDTVNALLIAPVWYLSAPVTIPLIGFRELALIAFAQSLSQYPFFCLTFASCMGAPPPPPPTYQQVFQDAVNGFLYYGTSLIEPLINDVRSLLGPLLPSTAAQATAAVSAAAPVTTKPAVKTLAAATTVNTVKAQTRPAASIVQTVAPKPAIAPKPLSFAVQGGLLVGKPQLSQSGSLRTAVTSTTSNLSNSATAPLR
jgi:hypothetical protein